MKYAWVDQHRDVFALSEMCAVLNVSIAGYRSWQKGGKPHRKHLTDSQMLFHIQVVHAEVKKAYGSPRMVKELRASGLPAGKDRVERLMQENGIYGKHKRKYKVTTDSKHRLFACSAQSSEPQLQSRRPQPSMDFRYCLPMD